MFIMYKSISFHLVLFPDCSFYSFTAIIFAKFQEKHCLYGNIIDTSNVTVSIWAY